MGLLAGWARGRRAKDSIPGWAQPDGQCPGMVELRWARVRLLLERRLPDGLEPRAWPPGVEQAAEREAAGLWPQLHLFSAGLP
jgi:hypothetical protein